MLSEETVRKTKQPRASYRFKGKSGGKWRYGADLIADMILGNITLQNEEIQKELLDWILTDDKNVFCNKRTGELIYALAAKRGNTAYAAKKGEKLNEILEAISEREFDTPVPGLRDSKYRYTKILL